MHLYPWKIGIARSRTEYRVQPQVMKWRDKAGMQQNRQQKVPNSGAKGAKAQGAPAQTKSKETVRSDAMPSEAEPQKPVSPATPPAGQSPLQARPAPIGPMPPPPSRQTNMANQRKRLGPGEKQALAGGMFVMFSLAVALAVGWWVTPAAPPSFSVTDMHARDARPAVLPPDTNEVEHNAYGSSGTSSAMMDVEAEPVEEVSVIPPAANKSSAAAPIKAEDSSASSAAVGPSSPAATAKTDDAKAAEREREVQRLKAQAYSETQKDRLGGTPPAKAAPDADQSKVKPSSTRERSAQSSRKDLKQAVAECDKQAGLFYRERCKWRLCNGLWGKNGCPSYDNESRATWQVGWLRGYGKRVIVNKKARLVFLSRFRLHG